MLKQAAAIIALMTVGSVSAVIADVHWPTRTSNYNITFDDLTFANAVTAYEIVMDVYADAVGDSVEFGVGLKSNYQNLNVFSTGGLSFRGGIDPENLTSYDCLQEFLFESELEGTWHFAYNSEAVADPQPNSASFITSTIRDGYHVLDFAGGGVGLLSDGGTFYIHLTLPGEWSVDISETGGVTRSINEEFTITSDFVYDTATDTTLFEAVAVDTPEWNLVASLIVTLYGDPAPILCDGDANGDGAVDPLDSGYVQARFGCPVDTGDEACDIADQNNDGAVDPLDVGYVQARFGKCG